MTSERLKIDFVRIWNQHTALIALNANITISFPLCVCFYLSLSFFVYEFAGYLKWKKKSASFVNRKAEKPPTAQWRIHLVDYLNNNCTRNKTHKHEMSITVKITSTAVMNSWVYAAHTIVAANEWEITNEKKGFHGQTKWRPHTSAHQIQWHQFMSANCYWRLPSVISFNMFHARSVCLIIFRCGYYWCWHLLLSSSSYSHSWFVFLLLLLLLFFDSVFVCGCFRFGPFCLLYIRRTFIAIRSS